MSDLHISQAFREHQARPILTPYEPVAIFLLKTGIKPSFLVFFEELLHAAIWLKMPKG
jgi:hypothetical protein